MDIQFVEFMKSEKGVERIIGLMVPLNLCTDGAWHNVENEALKFRLGRRGSPRL